MAYIAFSLTAYFSSLIILGITREEKYLIAYFLSVSVRTLFFAHNHFKFTFG